ncbi:MAG: TAT-variant-translocated molybdopterin oxidoreductase, partial [Verrucomicrobiales bacterium]
MSKRVFHHPDVPADETTVAWRSPGQLDDSPEFREWLEREFPRGAAEMADGEDAETSRRSFLKLMGASSALAGFGMAACRRPESYIVPYTKAPEWVIPGKATYYASSMPRAAGAVPLVVTNFEGRPTKLAPNKLHPDADGTDAFTQASVLDLYSPSRSRKPMAGGKPASRADLDAMIAELAKDPGAKVGFLFGGDVSPTRTRLRGELAAKFSGAKFYQYEALAGDGGRAYGDGAKPVADFSKAERILSFDCDFGSSDPVGKASEFFAKRKPEGNGYKAKPDAESMNRLYMVESAFSLTGGMADHRLRVAPAELLKLAGQIARELGVPEAAGMPAVADDKQLSWIEPLVADLKAHRGKSLIVAGSRQPAAVHHLVLAMNLVLGNLGKGHPFNVVQTGNAGLGGLQELIADIHSGAVETLVMMTPANPVYDAPADLDFPAALAKLKNSIHLGTRTDATAHAASWHIPAAHYLEGWSDARTAAGTYTVVQPMILPLYPDCVSELELLLALLSDDGKLINGEGAEGAASPAYDAVRKTFAGIGGEGDKAWKSLLRDGYLAGSAYTPIDAKPSVDARKDIPEAVKAMEAAGDSLQVVFAADASVYDGRYIDNAWLQEAPDPISKVTWDNAALIAPKTAKNLGIYDEILKLEPVTKALGFIPVEGKYAAVGPDGEGKNRTAPVIELKVNGKTLQFPVIVSFGQ